MEPIPAAWIPPHRPMRLFSPGNIVAASFLGSVLAGAILLALNYRRLGRPTAALWTAAIGAALTAAVVVLAMVTPDGAPTQMAFTIGNGLLVVGAWKVCERLQGDQIAAHRAAGGQVGATGPTIAVIALSLGLVVGGIVAYVIVTDETLGESVEVEQLTIYYKDGATQAQARQVGETMIDLGIYDATTVADIQVVGGTPPRVRFVMNDSAFTDEDIADEMRRAGIALRARVFGGDPIVIELVDAELEVGRRIPIE